MKFIKNILTFKTKFAEVITSEKVKECLEAGTKLIEKYNEVHELTNEEKKRKVDCHLYDYINEHLHSDNGLVQWIINRILDAIPFITQFIYDLIKKNIKGITEKV